MCMCVITIASIAPSSPRSHTGSRAPGPKPSNTSFDRALTRSTNMPRPGASYPGIQCQALAAAGGRGSRRRGSIPVAGPTSDEPARKPEWQDDWHRYQQADHSYQQKGSHDQHYPGQREGGQRKRKDSQADQHVVDTPGDLG